MENKTPRTCTKNIRRNSWPRSPAASAQLPRAALAHTCCRCRARAGRCCHGGARPDDAAGRAALDPVPERRGTQLGVVHACLPLSPESAWAAELAITLRLACNPRVAAPASPAARLLRAPCSGCTPATLALNSAHAALSCSPSSSSRRTHYWLWSRHVRRDQPSTLRQDADVQQLAKNSPSGTNQVGKHRHVYTLVLDCFPNNSS